jgi:hypothetical protein
VSEIHIAEVGEFFPNQDSFDFLSDQNMLEYDFIIVDNDTLVKSINGQLLNDIELRFSDLKDFATKKNIPVVFLGTIGGFFEAISSNGSIYELLGIEVTEESSAGRKIEINSNSLFADFLNINAAVFEYNIAYSVYPGISLGNAKSKSLSIGFYTKDFVFLPSLAEDPDIDDNVFLNQLYEICRSVRKDLEIFSIPNWANEYLLPGEENERENLKQIENKIVVLVQQKTDSENRLATFFPLKQLWSGSGNALENAAKKVFEELGFTLLHSELGRDDIVMRWNHEIIIVEVKGQSKSAAEKNAAQLEKWLSTYTADKGIEAKGILLVNTYRELPLEKRTQPSFPNQMLSYSERRNHCLLTTLQLCTLLLYCRKNPAKKKATIEELISTVGPYKQFIKWQDFISTVKNKKNSE